MRVTRRKARRSNGDRTTSSSAAGSNAAVGAGPVPARLAITRLSGINPEPKLYGISGRDKPSPYRYSRRSFNRKVLCFRMMDDDRRSRLLGLELKFLSQLHVDTGRIDQLKQLRLVLQIR